MIYDTTALSGLADGFESMRAIVRDNPRIVIPVVVLGEYGYGLRSSKVRARREQWLAQILPACEVIPITETTAQIYTRIAEQLKAKGRVLGQNDIWIAATAFQLKLPIVISNDKDFDHVEGLARLGFYDPRHSKS